MFLITCRLSLCVGFDVLGGYLFEGLAVPRKCCQKLDSRGGRSYRELDSGLDTFVADR